MKNPASRRSSSRAFTLIELLVVIGLIGLLAGGIGVAMKNKNPGTGLRSAQSTLVSLLSSARGQSALNQVDAMILVQADPTADNFLRSIRVVVLNATTPAPSSSTLSYAAVGRLTGSLPVWEESNIDRPQRAYAYPYDFIVYSVSPKG